jgi:hypothetical protein
MNLSILSKRETTIMRPIVDNNPITMECNPMMVVCSLDMMVECIPMMVVCSLTVTMECNPMMVVCSPTMTVLWL